MTTLLALFRRPDGGAEALAEFERRYATEHLPLVAGDARAPRDAGPARRRGARRRRRTSSSSTTMRFDDRAALDAGLASDAMRAGRPEPARDRARPGHAPRARGRAGTGRGGFPGRGYCQHDEPKEPSDRTPATPRPATATPGRASRSRRRPRRRRPRPRALDGVALVTHRPARGAQRALSFDLLDELADALEALDADPACRAIVLTGAGTRAFAAGADIRELATQTSASLADGRPLRGLGPARRDRHCR